jgi:hypothetical protein
MAKTLKDFVKSQESLIEQSIEDIVSVVKEEADTCVIGPLEIGELSKFASQISNSQQPTIPKVLNKIEAELNRFGYTLGEIDYVDPFEEEGSEDYIILTFADGREVANAYLTLQWRRASEKTSMLNPDFNMNMVELSVVEIDPSEYEELVYGGEDDESISEGSGLAGLLAQAGLEAKQKKKVEKEIQNLISLQNSLVHDLAIFVVSVDDMYLLKHTKIFSDKDRRLVEDMVKNYRNFTRQVEKDMEVLSKIVKLRLSEDTESVETLGEAYKIYSGGSALSVMSDNTKLRFVGMSSTGLSISMEEDPAESRNMFGKIPEFGKTINIRIPKNKLDEFVKELIAYLRKYNKLKAPEDPSQYESSQYEELDTLLDEAFKARQVGKVLSIVNEKDVLDFSLLSSGNLGITINENVENSVDPSKGRGKSTNTANIVIPKNRLEEFLDSVTEYLFKVGKVNLDHKDLWL